MPFHAQLCCEIYEDAVWFPSDEFSTTNPSFMFPSFLLTLRPTRRPSGLREEPAPHTGEGRAPGFPSGDFGLGRALAPATANCL